MNKDVWASGEWAWFEYHCFQSFNSQDAHLWVRSRQPVQVIGLDDCDVVPELDTFDKRMDAAMPLVYQIKFPDGMVGSAFEDELTTTPADFERGFAPPSTPAIVAGYKP